MIRTQQYFAFNNNVFYRITLIFYVFFLVWELIYLNEKTEVY